MTPVHEQTDLVGTLFEQVQSAPLSTAATDIAAATEHIIEATKHTNITLLYYIMGYKTLTVSTRELLRSIYELCYR